MSRVSFFSLAGLMSVALAVPAAASAQSAPLIQGEVNAATADEFVRLIEDAADSTVALDVTAPALDSDGALITRPEDTPDGLMSITARGDETEVEVAARVPWEGAWRLQGVYRVEYVSMNQGIMAYFLRPAPDVAVSDGPAHRLGGGH